MTDFRDIAEGITLLIIIPALFIITHLIAL